MTPDRNVVEAEGVPPAIEHRLIEAEDAFAGDTGGSGRELTQAIEDKRPLLVIDAADEMPQREGVMLARLRKNQREVGGTLLRRCVVEIESSQGGA